MGIQFLAVSIGTRFELIRKNGIKTTMMSSGVKTFSIFIALRNLLPICLKLNENLDSNP
jgi:hypothetical protein